MYTERIKIIMNHWHSHVTRTLMNLILPIALIITSVGAPQAAFAQSAPQTEPRSTTPLYADVQVDATCNGGSCGTANLANSYTTRKLAVSSNGTIFALFYGADGIWVSKSTTRGRTFGDAKRVSTTNAEPEIAIAADDTAYVIWSDGTDIKLATSTDLGVTWTVGTVGAGVGSYHLTVDGDNLYATGGGNFAKGSKVWYSNDGGSTWSSTDTGTSEAFADVHVDPFTGNLYLFVDNPLVKWYISSDKGATLTGPKATGKSVFFSVGALTSDGTDAYFFMAGQGTNLERINLNDETVLSQTVTGASGGRALAADSCGYVVSGGVQSGTMSFQVSTDSGSTFGDAITVASDTGNSSSVLINKTNGDVVVLYGKNNDAFVTTYSGLLSAGLPCYALTLSRTAIDFSRIGETQTVVITNSSSSTVNLDSISMSGSQFTMSHNCGASLAAGASCTVSISGSRKASEILSIVSGAVTKRVPVTLGDRAVSRPTATARAATSTRTATSVPTNTFTPTNTASPTNTFTPTPHPFAIKDVAVGASFTLAVLQNNTLVTWGFNREGQASLPVWMNGRPVNQVETGSNYALALGTDGRVYGWGKNDFGQLNIPTAATSGVRTISAGLGHVMAIKTNGSLVIWGRNDFKQTQAPAIARTGLSAIAAGHSHSLAVKSGKVLAWGRNTWGQTNVPSTLTNVIAVSGGFDHSLALRSNGSVVCWGRNNENQCKLPNGMKDVIAISAGIGYSLALTRDGQVYAWGRNNLGQAKIPNGINKAGAISAGYVNSVIGLRDASVVAFGDSSLGALVSRTPTVTP